MVYIKREFNQYDWPSAYNAKMVATHKSCQNAVTMATKFTIYIFIQIITSTTYELFAPKQKGIFTAQFRDSTCHSSEDNR